MGKITGFMEFKRETPEERPITERSHDYKEIYKSFSSDKVRQQAARCMNCGVPFCHSGCPLGNLIPDWNDLVFKGLWKQALARLHATNNFPEFTGRVCPAPCEEACVLGITDPPVTIELIEKSIVEYGFEKGWIVPEPPARRTGKRVAVIGSGPAGLAAAQQLNRAGHTVTVFERADKPGGLLRYGIPGFKLEKSVIDRRIALMKQEGIVFVCNADAGKNPSVEELLTFDAVVLCGGATQPRDLPVPGRNLKGIHYAMDVLRQQNRVNSGQPVEGQIHAKDKHVIVIGGGDTGSDCVGTAVRHGAKSIVNFEFRPMPPTLRPENQPWPYWPMRLRTSSSLEEGGQRYFSIMTKEFTGIDGHVRKLHTVNIEMDVPPGSNKPVIREIPGTDYEWRADLVILAMGFIGPDPDGVVSKLGCQITDMGSVRTDNDGRTTAPKVYAAGDMHRGQSLVVWAIAEGRDIARTVDTDLMGSTSLPSRGGPDLPRIGG